MVTKFKVFESHYEIDPYGEENWDEISIGSTVVVLPKIKEYIDMGRWPKNFTSLIGKKIKIQNIKTVDGYECYVLSGYIIPKDCVEIVK